MLPAGIHRTSVSIGATRRNAMKATSITCRDFTRRALALTAAPCVAPFATGLASTAHGQSRQPGTVKTALSWIPNHQFAGMWIALDRGWFDADGVKVEWRAGGA